MLAWPFGLARQQIASYAPLKGIVAAGDASAIHPPNPPLRCWPSIADVLSSRKVRVWLPFSLLALTVFVLGHPYDALPAIRTGVSKGEENNNGQQPPAAAPGWDSNSNAPPDIADAVDWSRFAYVQYVTDSHYLCNSVMLFERLQQLGSRADRVLMYPSRMLDPTVADGGASNDARLLIKARDEYNAKLVPIEVHHREVGEDKTWAESCTKLLAFNQTQYDRVLALDSDSTVLQNLDELFLLPSCPVAMPRAYWLYPEKQFLASHIMLLQPSASEFARVMDRVSQSAASDYDMEIVNALYRDSALVLPHRPYALLTNEFRRAPDQHKYYLGNEQEEWDPVAVFNEAKYLHFSDWPVPKPWLPTKESVRVEEQPACHVRHGVESCVERELWNGFYSEFRERRERVCGSGGGKRPRQRR